MFDQDIFISTNKSGPECPKTINLMTAVIERTLRFGNSTSKLSLYNSITFKTLTDVAQLPDIGDIMWYISDIFTMGVQYGGRTEMCSILTNGTIYNTTT